MTGERCFRRFPSWRHLFRLFQPKSLVDLNPSTERLPTIAIIAPGLLGASLASASKARGICAQVNVWARREETRKECKNLHWCDRCFETIEEAVKEADIVWVCAPVGSIARLVGRFASSLKPGAIVSDVGSTKEKLTLQCEQAMGGSGVFVGSHPMAGSEKSGPAHADADLYAGKACFVTPSPQSPPEAVAVIQRYWEALGMQVHRISPREHDHIVACISHLPHLVSATLAAKVSEMGGDQWRQFVGNGLLDTTRVAAGSVPMWMDIVEHNRDEILPVMRQMIAGLEHLRVHLENGQYDAVRELLIAGKEYRDSLF